MADSDHFKAMAGAVAREFLGEPNKALSGATELRFGSKGSLSVDLGKGTFYDHTENAGGGVIWFVERETGAKGKDAVEELRKRGFDVEDRGPPPDYSQDFSGNNAPPPRDEPRMREVATWDYHDADGKMIFQVVRMEDGSVGDDGKPSKTYRQRRPDASKNGGWDWSTKGMKMTPYRLPEVLSAIKKGQTVFIVEGEKAVDRLMADGVPATTNPRGAGKWLSEFNQYFASADVVVLPDNDPQAINKKTGQPKFHDNGDPVLPGQDHAHAVAAQLQDVAASVKLLELPGLPLKGDVVEWLDADGDIDTLYNLCEDLGVYEAKPFRSSFGAITWSQLDDPGPEHEWLIKNVLTRGEIAMVAGQSQAGKSFAVLDACMAISRGIPWFGNRTLRGAVAYQAGEGARGIKKRIRAYRNANNLTLKDDLPFVLLPARIDLYSSDDHTEKMIEEIKHWKRAFNHPLELIVIDTFATATPGGNENDGRDVSLVLERCARVSRETNAAVLLVHHLNADKSKIRGHTSLTANLENLLLVEQVEDHFDGEGRQLRRATVAKSKDGVGGAKFNFVLRSVNIGVDEDGDPITSCVIMQPDGTGTDAPKQVRPKVTDKESLLLRSVEQALDSQGSPPPASSGISTDVSWCVEWKMVGQIYDKLCFDDVDEATEDPDDRKRRLDARRKAMARAGEGLMRKGILERSNPYVWLTRRRVPGHARRTAPMAAPDHTEPQDADDLFPEALGE